MGMALGGGWLYVGGVCFKSTSFPGDNTAAMGGHHSTQSSTESSSIMTNATLNVAQNCLSYVDGTQVIGIYGSGNVFRGNIQSSQLSVDMRCVDAMGQQGSFSDQLTSSIEQELADQEVALTQWLDSSSDTQKSAITQRIVEGITFTDVENCLASVDGTQLFVVDGSNNVIVDNLQEQTQNLATQCLLSGGQAANVVNDVTNTTNQHSTYDSENPFAFITDAIQSVFQSGAVLAVVLLIAVVLFAVVYKLATRRGKKSPTAVAPDAPVAPTS